jgi:hypothetical protein
VVALVTCPRSTGFRVLGLLAFFTLQICAIEFVTCEEVRGSQLTKGSVEI